MSLFPVRGLRRATLLCIAVLLIPALAHASTVFVSVNGTDSGSCGPKPDPCRTITQGIANSAVGGSIVVGPGSYGDIDRDGTYGEPGEEPGPNACGASTCMIYVNKSVTITSSSGAFATAIVTGPDNPQATVYIDAPGAVFGDAGKGFTIASPPSSGCAAIASLAPAPGAVIEGNLIQTVEDASLGILVTSDNQVRNNRVLGTYNTSGIFLFGDNCVASGNVVSGGAQGLRIYGNSNVLSDNIADGNDVGLEIGSGTGNTITRSSFLGNGFAGVLVEDPASTASITDSNIAGNATNSAPSSCAFAANGSAVTATNVWWGDESGPGADPSDDACNAAMGATTPFATSPFKVKVRGMR